MIKQSSSPKGVLGSVVRIDECANAGNDGSPPSTGRARMLRGSSSSPSLAIGISSSSRELSALVPSTAPTSGRAAFTC